MSFNWPTAEQMTYRIMRLHRLVVLAVTIPTLVILSVAWNDPSVLSAPHATVAVFGIVALVLGHVALFPNATLETIALSLSAAALIIFMPLLKLLSLWAPAEYASGAFVVLVFFAVAVTAVMIALLQLLLSGLLNAGPAWNKPLKASMNLPCSPQVAVSQFTLRPETRRGRVLTGEVDDNGFFDVAVAVGQSAMAENPNQPAILKLDAKVMKSTPEQHDVMMVLRNGSVTVTSQTFEKTADGCTIHVSDLPSDFTVGMHFLFWLTDQQMDHLTETADTVLGRESRANSAAHNVSVLTVAGGGHFPRAPPPL